MSVWADIFRVLLIYYDTRPNKPAVGAHINICNNLVVCDLLRYSLS